MFKLWLRKNQEIARILHNRPLGLGRLLVSRLFNKFFKIVDGIRAEATWVNDTCMSGLMVGR